MEETHTELPPAPWKDRSTGLVAFGVIQICLGALCAMLAALSLLGMAMIAAMPADQLAATGASPGSMIVGVLFYVVVAAWFITMGVGSIRARRWARALILVWSCLCLFCGILGILMMVFFMGDMYDQMGASGQLPPGTAGIVQVVTVGMMLVIYVVIPGSFLLFYRTESVRKTCEWRNPGPSWTDACPLPVLAHAMLFLFYAVFILAMVSYQWATPLFGRIITGAPGAMLVIATSGLFCLLACGVYRLKRAAWWGSIALIVFWATSATVTFSRVSLMEFYERAGMNEQQLDMLRPLVDSARYNYLMTGSGVLWAGVLLALFVFTRRYYPRGEVEASTP